MTRLVRMVQASFTAGEIAPEMYGRIDTTRYYAAAQRLENVMVQPQGGLRRRPGMRHIADIPDGAAGVRLIPFAFNVNQTFLFVLTDGTFRVYRGADGVLLATVTGCPWNGAQAAQMNWAQSADTLLLTHHDVQPQRIRRGGTDSIWTRDAVPLTNIPTHDYGSGAEPVISATRGWPESVTFHQGRLWLAGFRSRPATFMGSKAGEFFNFDQGTGLDDEAIYATIETDQVNPIHQVASGRNLQFFTAGAEYAVLVEPPITPGKIAVQEQTRQGIRRHARVMELDGAALYVQGNGAGLRQFLYSEVERAYDSELLSLLAPHLVRDAVGLAARKAGPNDAANHVLILNADGQMAVLTSLRTQEVVAFTRWTTDGQVRSMAPLLFGQVYFAVLRNGSMRLEVWDDEAVTDAAARLTFGTPVTTASGLSHLEGRSVAIRAGGIFQGLATVTGGTVSWSTPATQVELGLPMQLTVQPLPMEPRDASGALIGRRSRIVRTSLRVEGTSPFQVNGRTAVVRTLGTTLDSPPPTVAEDVNIEGMIGWRRRHTLTITQPAPGPFRLLALAYQIAVGE